MCYPVKILKTFILLAAGIAAFCVPAQALTADIWGGHYSSGDVPEVSAPSPVDTGNSSSQQTTQQTQPSVPVMPTTKQVVQQTIVTGVMQGVLDMLFAPPPQPTGPSPAELQKMQEEKKKQEEIAHQKFLNSNDQLVGGLKKVGDTTGSELKLKMPGDKDLNPTAFFGTPVYKGKLKDIASDSKAPADSGLKLKMPAAAQADNNSSGNGTVGLLRQSGPTEEDFAKMREYKSRIDELNKKANLTRAEQQELNQLVQARYDFWKSIVDNRNLTQADRERMKIKMDVALTPATYYAPLPSQLLPEVQYNKYMEAGAVAAKTFLTNEGLSRVKGAAEKKVFDDPETVENVMTAKDIGMDFKEDVASGTADVIGLGVSKIPGGGVVMNVVQSVGAGAHVLQRYSAAEDSGRVTEQSLQEVDRNYDDSYKNMGLGGKIVTKLSGGYQW